MLEVRPVIGFPLILKTEHSLSLLIALIQSLTKLTVGSPKGQYQGHSYIDDFHHSIKFFKVRHFAHDTNLINFNSSIKVINTQVNEDLKTLYNWLNANKICLNISKTEIVLFRNDKKQLHFGLRFKPNAKKLYPTN